MVARQCVANGLTGYAVCPGAYMEVRRRLTWCDTMAVQRASRGGRACPAWSVHNLCGGAA
eukprot:scaffold71455_cov95-Phaeocystis_antarctica.AAC.3